MNKGRKREISDLPLLQPLHALRVELLHGHHRAHAALWRIESLLPHPALVHLPESALSENGLGLEVPSGTPELGEGIDAKVGRLQDPPLREHLLDADADAAAGGLPQGRAAAVARKFPGGRLAAAGPRRRATCAISQKAQDFSRLNENSSRK